MLALLSDDNSYLQTQINTSKQDNLRAATKVIKTIDILEKRIYISWKMEYFKVERVHYSHFIFILSFNGIIKIKIILDANKVRKLTSECKNKKNGKLAIVYFLTKIDYFLQKNHTLIKINTKDACFSIRWQ